MKKTPIHGKLTKVNDKLLYDNLYVYRFIWNGSYVLETLPIKDKNSFKIFASVENTIFKLDNKLFWNNYDITDQLDINTFEYLGGHFAKDIHNVYFVSNSQNNNLKKIVDSDPATFKVINKDLAYDKRNVYCNTKIIIDADPKTIQKSEKGGLKDKSYEWNWNREKGEWQKVSNDNK